RPRQHRPPRPRARGRGGLDVSGTPPENETVANGTVGRRSRGASRSPGSPTMRTSSRYLSLVGVVCLPALVCALTECREEPERNEKRSDPEPPRREKVATFALDGDRIRGISYAGRLLVTYELNPPTYRPYYTVRLWDVDKGKPLLRFQVGRE